MRKLSWLSPGIVGALSASVFSNFAHANNSPPTHLFLGTDLGWGTVSRYAAPEGDRSGLQFDLKGLVSFYWPNLILDLGAGWQYGKRSGQNLNNSFSKTFSRGTFLEGSFRYGKFTGWQVGPIVDIHLVGDVGLGNGQLIESQALKPVYGGLVAFYEFPEWGYRVRVGGRWMTDLNIDSRNAHIFQASFEIGWPLAKQRTARARPTRRAGYQIVQKDRATKKVRIILDARRIEFDYDQATLRPEAARRLQSLGTFLSANLDKWEDLRITGHTDERGSVQYNQKLSEDRAAAVKNALVKAAVPREKMESRGLSENFPIDPGHNEYAWQRNRRVEFEFTGVQDLDLIVDGVNQSTSDDQVSEE